MNLGAFSISLSVKDIAASRAFYEKLDFEVVGGDQDQGWLILRNEETVLGLFQGMFPKNTLTFNPGFSQRTDPLDDFDDVRELQEELQARGLELVETTDPDGTGVAHIALIDPDGNPILIDQHVPRP